MGVGGRRPVLFLEALTQDGNHGENNEPVDPLPSGINVPLEDRDGDVGGSAKVCAGIEEPYLSGCLPIMRPGESTHRCRGFRK
jgi:hypothetical protein